MDEDHRGGLEILSRITPIGGVLSAPAQWKTSAGGSLKERLLTQGIPLLSGVPFETYLPSVRSGRANSGMGAILIPLRGGGFYLSAGDADQKQETEIALWLKQHWPVTENQRILKISHHGSKTSSAPALIQTVNPTRAWISVGKGNSYGHPSSLVLTRLRDLGVSVERTDQKGDLRSDEETSAIDDHHIAGHPGRIFTQ
jgi:competence protein ComEC